MAKKRGLGRGLDALLGNAALGAVPTYQSKQDDAGTIDDSAEDAEQLSAVIESSPGVEPGSIELDIEVPDPEQFNTQSSAGQLKYLPIEYLSRGAFQPRREFDANALEELSQSIQKQGLMQPIVVRSLTKGRYEIIAGERRWRACQLAGLDTIPCLIKEVDDEAALVMGLIENMQREDLNPIEEAAGLHRLHTEFDLTHQQVAEVVGKSRSTVTNMMRLMHLEPEVKTLLERGDLDMGHARALLSLPKEVQIQAAKTAVARGLSVRNMEAYVKQLMTGSLDEGKKKAVMDPNIRDLENRLGEKLGAKVKIQHNQMGRGKLIVKYTSVSELEGILSCFDATKN